MEKNLWLGIGFSVLVHYPYPLGGAGVGGPIHENCRMNVHVIMWPIIKSGGELPSDSQRKNGSFTSGQCHCHMLDQFFISFSLRSTGNSIDFLSFEQKQCHLCAYSCQGVEAVLQMEQDFCQIDWEWSGERGFCQEQNGGVQHSYEEDDEEPLWVSPWSGSVLFSSSFFGEAGFFLQFDNCFLWASSHCWMLITISSECEISWSCCSCGSDLVICFLFPHISFSSHVVLWWELEPFWLTNTVARLLYF